MRLRPADNLFKPEKSLPRSSIPRKVWLQLRDFGHKIRDAIHLRILSPVFRPFEAIGVHVTPAHFYGPVPHSKELNANVLGRVFECPGIQFNHEDQVQRLETFKNKYWQEYVRLEELGPTGIRRFSVHNDRFGPVDAEILRCFVRDRRPSRIFEIGSGLSTRLMMSALLANEREGSPGALTVIDPFPSHETHLVLETRGELISAPVQNVPLERFSELEEGDILFIDSSHVLRTGSDVQFEFLEVIPRLNDGVAVHVHDIFLPEEYPSEWLLKKRRFWNEQYILQAFLTNNDRTHVLWGSYYMTKSETSLVADAIPSLQAKDRPGSFWFEISNYTDEGIV